MVVGKRGFVILVLVAVLISSFAFVSAGLFSNLFTSGKTGNVVANDGSCTFTNPQDLAGNGILVSNYFYKGNYTQYAERYCQVVKGCTGFDSSSVVVKDDAVKACRCDSYWGCEGESCVSNVATSPSWERVGSVTCTGCPSDACSTGNEEPSVPVCGNGIVERGEDCDGADLGGVTCSDFGYAGGTIRCSLDCNTFNLINCIQKNSTSSEISGCNYLTDSMKSKIASWEEDGRNVVLKEGEKVYYKDKDLVVIPSGTSSAVVFETEYVGHNQAVFTNILSGESYTVTFASNGIGILIIGNFENRLSYTDEGESSFVTFDFPDAVSPVNNKLNFGACIQETNQATNQIQRCVDSDGGINYDVKGKVSGFEENDSPLVNWEDHCINSDILSESYCENGNPKQITRDCGMEGRVCSNGACIQETNQTTNTFECDMINSSSMTCVFDGTIYSIKKSGCSDNLNLTVTYEQNTEFFNLAELSQHTLKNGIVIKNRGSPCSVNRVNLEFSSMVNDTPDNTINCDLGCTLDGKCYPFGYRKNGMYCSDGYEFVNQVGAELSCENNFECSSNLCVDSQCVSSSLIQKFLSWFKNLFG